MTMAVILASIAGADEDAATLEAAHALARHVEAHIRVLHIRADAASMLILASPESARGRIARVLARL